MLALVTALALTAGPTFIEDDYPRALKTARAKKKLLVVDAWAPWCHSCIFMREHVLNQPAFAAFEKDVVFASIDTDQAKSAAFLEKFPVNVWPTFLFIDPVTETVRLRWAGSFVAERMATLLDAAQHPLPDGGSPLVAPAGDAAGVQQFHAAREAGTAGGREAVLLFDALWEAKAFALCAQTALDEGPHFAAASDRAGVVGSGLACASMLPAGAQRDALQAPLVKLTKELLGAEGLLSDDVSSLYSLLVEERRAAKDDQGVRTLGATWSRFLSDTAAKAKTPAGRAVFDAHRVQAAIAAGQAGEMIAPLKQSETDFPKDYNPPARLALLYRELKQWPQAHAAVDRALSRCDGPRRIGLLQTKASVYERQGDRAKQRATLEAALAYAVQLPKAQRSEKYLADLKAAAEAVREEPAAPK